MSFSKGNQYIITNDYRLKSCILIKVDDLKITGRTILTSIFKKILVHNAYEVFNSDKS